MVLPVATPGERLLLSVVVEVLDPPAAEAEVRRIAEHLEVSPDEGDLSPHAVETTRLQIRAPASALPPVVSELGRLGSVRVERADKLPRVASRNAAGSDPSVAAALEARRDLRPLDGRRTASGFGSDEPTLGDEQDTSLLVVSLVDRRLSHVTHRVHAAVARDLEDGTAWAGPGVSMGARVAALEAMFWADPRVSSSSRPYVLHVAAVLIPHDEKLGRVVYARPYGTLGFGASFTQGRTERTEAYVPLGLGMEWIRGDVLSLGTELRAPLYFASARGFAMALSPTLTLEVRP